MCVDWLSNEQLVASHLTKFCRITGLSMGRSVFGLCIFLWSILNVHFT